MKPELKQTPFELQARKETKCRGCGKPKTKGCIVCWDCFKYRTDITPFKEFTGSLEDWLQLISSQKTHPFQNESSKYCERFYLWGFENFMGWRPLGRTDGYSSIEELKSHWVNKDTLLGKYCITKSTVI